MKLEGRVALVTGAGRNLGRAAALLLAREGASVVVNGLTNQGAIDDVAHLIESGGARAMSILTDVSDSAAVEKMVHSVEVELGVIDIVVSNAAIRPHGGLTDIDDAMWRKVMAVDLDATFYLSRATIPGMVGKGKGSIIAVSGLAPYGMREDSIATATAKAGLEGMMRGIAVLYGRSGVRANTVVPGRMATDRFDQDAYLTGKVARLVRSAETDLKDELIPLGRKGLLEEFAAAVLFLASDDSSFTTGQTLHVNGGSAMR